MACASAVLWVRIFFCPLRTLIFLFFFFSSRRRHTRLVSDWSSDVCSSDLKSKSESFLKADLSKMSDALRITKGVDAIVHLGGYSVEGPWDGILKANIVGCYRSEEHTSELQSLTNLVCRLLLEKKNKKETNNDDGDLPKSPSDEPEHDYTDAGRDYHTHAEYGKPVSTGPRQSNTDFQQPSLGEN